MKQSEEVIAQDEGMVDGMQLNGGWLSRRWGMSYR